jgi:tetratricopeptide (TPR) repeat protein
MDLNKFDSAFVDYKQALVIKPNYHVAMDNLGGWYARRSRYDSALYYFNRVLQQKPDYKVTYSNRGLTYMGLKQYELAIKDWQKVLEYEPGAADVVNTIGLCYRMMGKNQDALGYINRAIQLLPDPAFFLNRSYTYSALNNKENARKDALTAKQGGVKVDPSYAASLGIQ